MSHAQIQVKQIGIAPPETLTGDEFRKANAAYFAALTRLVGPHLTARALDLYLDWVEHETNESASRGGGVKVAQVSLVD